MTDIDARRLITVLLIALGVAFALGIWAASQASHYKEEANVLQSRLDKVEQAIKPMSLDELEKLMEPLPLEDRFVSLMEALSDNGTMRYDVDIEATLLSDDSLDKVRVILRLKEGQHIGEEVK